MFTGTIASPIIFFNETIRQGSYPCLVFDIFLKLFVAVLTITKKSSIINKIFLKGHTTMAVYTSMNNMITDTQHVELVQISPGLYCRTQISE